MSIVASDWRPLAKNTLQGFCTLTPSPSGIVLRECALHERDDGRRWIRLPSKAQIDTEGRHRSDPRLLDFKPVHKGSLRGFASVKLPNGLVVNDVAISESHGKQWALLPSKAMIDRDGNLMRDAGGRIRYSPIVQWGTSDLRDEFSRRLVALVRSEFPSAFDTQAAP
jgi:hypothetical protein